MTALVRIPFRGTEVLAVDVEGRPHVVLKPAIEALGIDYANQYRKLQGKSWATVVTSTTVGADGKVRPMVTVDVRTFLMLLATIDENRVSESARPLLVAYQSEVADAIEAYWTQGGAINPRATDDQLATIIGHAEAQARVLRSLSGIVDPRWLEAKARHVAARALGEEPEIDPATRPLTVGEYLQEKGVTGAALRSLSGNFGKSVKRLYIQRTGEEPTKLDRFVDGAMRPVAIYTEAERDLFDAAWTLLGVAS
jgi:hypothetical protein